MIQPPTKISIDLHKLHVELKRAWMQERQWRLNCPEVPQQTNGYDCGVFMMLFANYASAGHPIHAESFTQMEVTDFFRPICAIECFKQQLRKLD
jgi:Ulp1 family protease